MILSIFGYIVQAAWVEKYNVLPGRKTYIELLMDDLEYKKFYYFQFFRVAFAFETRVNEQKYKEVVGLRKAAVKEILKKSGFDQGFYSAIKDAEKAEPKKTKKPNLFLLKNKDYY